MPDGLNYDSINNAYCYYYCYYLHHHYCQYCHYYYHYLSLPVVNFGEVQRVQLAKSTLLTSTMVPLGSFQIL